MYKINYNQHDWNKGEVIKEENLDNMENGIKQATNKINEIIDTEQDFKDRMADIDRRIDINNEELVVARDGCDNLGQRIERDQQYIYNILNDGSYLEFNGTDVTVDNAKEGYTKDTIIKGQTYQNLVDFSQGYTRVGNENYITVVNNKISFASESGDGNIRKILTLLKPNTLYTICTNVYSLPSKDDIPIRINDYDFNTANSTYQLNIFRSKITKTGLYKDTFTTGDKPCTLVFYASTNNINFSCSLPIVLEGDWTNKEVPTNITGIESVGEKENNKISILSHNKNLIRKEDFVKAFDNIPNVTRVNFDNKDCLKITGTLKRNVVIEPYIKTNAIKTLKLSAYTDSNDGSSICQYGNYIMATVNAWSDGYGSSLDNKVVIYNYVDRNVYIDLDSIQLELGQNATKHVDAKQDKKEIQFSLDSGLKSLSNEVCDTIEQREDGVYLVQRVGKVNFNGSENWNIDGGFTNQSQKVMRFSCGVTDASETLGGSGNKIICDTLPIINNENGDILPKIWCSWRNYIYIDIDPTRLNISFANDNNDTKKSKFKSWLQANPVTVYYLLATPIETKLNINNINLQTFKDLTYVISDNNIEPVLEFKAPVDINQTIADLQEEQEQLIETYNTLKEENEAVKTAVSELNEQEDVQTADMLDLDMRVLALEEGLE